MQCFISRVAAYPERLQYIYFDAVLVRPTPGSTFAHNLAAAHDAADALARTIALATPADVAQTWAAGDPLRPV